MGTDSLRRQLTVVGNSRSHSWHGLCLTMPIMVVLSLKRKPSLRRGGVEELRKIADTREFAIAAADYLSVQPITLPQGFSMSWDTVGLRRIQAGR